MNQMQSEEPGKFFQGSKVCNEYCEMTGLSRPRARGEPDLPLATYCFSNEKKEVGVSCQTHRP